MFTHMYIIILLIYSFLSHVYTHVCVRLVEDPFMRILRAKQQIQNKVVSQMGHNPYLYPYLYPYPFPYSDPYHNPEPYPLPQPLLVH